MPAGNAEPKLQAPLIGTDLAFAARTSLELAAEVEQGEGDPHMTIKGDDESPGMDACLSVDTSQEKMPSSQAYFTTVNQAPIDLPEQVLVMIVSRVRDARPATAEAGARSLCADVMHGIGSVSRLWRRLVKGVLMGDELVWLRVPGAAAAAECMSCFPRALSLRIVGDARSGDIGAVLGSRSVMRLALETNNVIRDCEGLGQLVGLRALCIAYCGRLRDVAALSSLVDLRTLRFTRCRLRVGSLALALADMAQLTSLDLRFSYIGDAGAASLAPSLALMAQLTSLDLGINSIRAAGAASLAPSLALMAQLTSLDLSCNGISAVGAASLAPSLAAMAQLTSLHLGVNGISAAGAASLAPSLALMAQLTSLNLGCNEIYAAGAASLAPSLALMSQLTSLNLGGNSIGDAGAASLAPSLALMARLTSLDLSYNVIGDAGAAWLPRFAKTSSYHTSSS